MHGWLCLGIVDASRSKRSPRRGSSYLYIKPSAAAPRRGGLLDRTPSSIIHHPSTAISNNSNTNTLCLSLFNPLPIMTSSSNSTQTGPVRIDPMTLLGANLIGNLLAILEKLTMRVKDLGDSGSGRAAQPSGGTPRERVSCCCLFSCYSYSSSCSSSSCVRTCAVACRWQHRGPFVLSLLS